jgi:cytochrome c oxidase cbb3-type subunit III
MVSRRMMLQLATLIAVPASTACERSSDAATLDEGQAAQPPGASPQTLDPRPQAVSDTLRFVSHGEHIPAGFPSVARPLALTNPYEGNARAAQTGGQLFVAYNCIDCHGADGSGAMGPSLADGRWHFGGGPAEVFESIYQGRPEGMPAWGGRIADDQIWMLVTYVRALSAGKDVSTENFTGRTVERTGH